MLPFALDESPSGGAGGGLLAGAVSPGNTQCWLPLHKSAQVRGAAMATQRMAPTCRVQTQQAWMASVSGDPPLAAAAPADTMVVKSALVAGLSRRTLKKRWERLCACWSRRRRCTHRRGALCLALAAAPND
jgi:hypothetical protein